jgi:hypothetical protein
MKGATDSELTNDALDGNIGMLVSNLVIYFIILSTGATLFKPGKTQIQTATDAAAPYLINHHHRPMSLDVTRALRLATPSPLNSYA